MDYYLNQEEAIELFCHLVHRHTGVAIDKLNENDVLLKYLRLYGMEEAVKDIEEEIEKNYIENKPFAKKTPFNLTDEEDENVHARSPLTATQKRQKTKAESQKKFKKLVWSLSAKIRYGRPVWMSEFNLDACLSYIKDEEYSETIKYLTRLEELSLNSKRNLFQNTKWRIYFYDEYEEIENDKLVIRKGISISVLSLKMFGKAELIRTRATPNSKEITTYIGRYRFYDNGQFLAVKMKLAGSKERDLRALVYIGSEATVTIATGLGANVSHDVWARSLVIQKIVENDKINSPGFFCQDISNKRNSEIPEYIWKFFSKKEDNMIRTPRKGTSILELHKILESRNRSIDN